MSLVYQNSAYQVVHYPFLPENARLFLDQVHWGSQGTKYRRPISPEAAARLYRPWAFVIESPEGVVGTVLANEYTFQPNIQGFYFRFFASHPLHRGKAILGLNAKRVMNWLTSRLSDQDVCYAYLEKRNEPSLRMVKHLGFEPFHTSITVGFSRFQPKLAANVFRMETKEDQARISKLLGRYYQDHVFVHSAGWHFQNQYFVIKEQDTIVAGLQVIPARWEVVQMEGILGSFLIRFGQNIPFVNRIFNPSSFQFLGLEGIFVQPGREKELLKLMEHVLALYGVHAALFWQDPTSPYFLGNRRDLGLLNHFVKGTGSYLMAKNMPEDWKKRPAYISCFDFV